ncbi:BlaI/MecI/CopY family transcriptional regulator [Streptomyces sp. NPDC050485]|uniref:BlaI/MecI/CopY family transcriptional regulator n=1 Tax=Streptomyces sp. NPDC050485 TaxID=3365617 RepID=UPI003798CAE7
MNHEDAPGERRPSGALEAEVLGLLHDAGEPLIPRQVRDRLGGDLAYSTVVTVLSRMYDKGLLRRIQQGRAFAYAPDADAPGLAARRMRQVLEDGGDREAVLTRFVDDLSSGDEALLRRLLGGDLHPDQ